MGVDERQRTENGRVLLNMINDADLDATERPGIINDAEGESGLAPPDLVKRPDSQSAQAAVTGYLVQSGGKKHSMNIFPARGQSTQGNAACIVTRTRPKNSETDSL